MPRLHQFLILLVSATTLLLTVPEAQCTENSAVDSVIIRVQELVSANKHRQALEILKETQAKFPDNMALIELKAQLLFDTGRFGEVERLIEASQRTTLLDKLLASTKKRLERVTGNYAIAIITIQKDMDVEDFRTAIAIADRALQKFPEKELQFLTLKGEALYKNNELEAAEVEFRKVLNLDPLNDVAKGYVAEIRSTMDARVSKGWAEWVLIFKDKVGDFIVTFLALFAAFVVNSLLAPIGLRLKLNHARRSFERGDYDEFTDLIEGLLDQENFGVLRSNFRFVLKQGLVG